MLQSVNNSAVYHHKDYSLVLKTIMLWHFNNLAKSISRTIRLCKVGVTFSQVAQVLNSSFIMLLAVVCSDK
jgi:hypothetical protein